MQEIEDKKTIWKTHTLEASRPVRMLLRWLFGLVTTLYGLAKVGGLGEQIAHTMHLNFERYTEIWPLYHWVVVNDDDAACGLIDATQLRVFVAMIEIGCGLSVLFLWFRLPRVRGVCIISLCLVLALGQAANYLIGQPMPPRKVKKKNIEKRN